MCLHKMERRCMKIAFASESQPWRNYTRNHGKCRGEKHRENRFAILFLTPLLLVSLNNSLHVIATRTCEMYHPDAQLPKHDQSSVKFREGEFTSIKKSSRSLIKLYRTKQIRRLAKRKKIPAFCLLALHHIPAVGQIIFSTLR